MSKVSNERVRQILDENKQRVRKNNVSAIHAVAAATPVSSDYTRPGVEEWWR